MITEDRVRSLLSYDAETGRFTWLSQHGGFVLGEEAGGKIGTGYVAIRIDGRRYRAHHLAWLLAYGCFPSLEIDHINGIKADNRLDNLRLATRSQNAANVGARKTNTSGFKGVSWCSRRQRWRASIGCSGKRKFLGYHDTPYAAAQAYLGAAKELFGEFARVA